MDAEGHSQRHTYMGEYDDSSEDYLYRGTFGGSLFYMRYWANACVLLSEDDSVAPASMSNRSMSHMLRFAFTWVYEWKFLFTV
jgi:hypothetical protein